MSDEHRGVRTAAVKTEVEKEGKGTEARKPSSRGLFKAIDSLM